ncbi:MAG: PfkB family carbohydrate kinase [Defluviitaleaceae bacterium]|nr:PfkB family carbohydrate kinase [Defluviitaleaceae bacterium]
MMLTRERLEDILMKITSVKIAVYGDLCLDIYWHADMRISELSRETPHFALPVVEERIYLGGGGNVAANISALRPKRVMASGTAGEDWRGRELMHLMHGQNIDTQYIVRAPHLITNAFCKPLRRGISDTVYEDPRLDFANTRPLGEETEAALIKALDAIAENADILCISDQLPVHVYGAVTDKIRARIIKLAENGLPVVVDSRDRVALYAGKNIIVKPNEIEAARAANITADDLGQSDPALALSQSREVIMTNGPRGSVYASGGKCVRIPARKVPDPIDTVGAGDTFISAFALATAAGASRIEAAYFAGLSGEVTIQKIGMTGTATPQEILAWYDKTHA